MKQHLSHNLKRITAGVCAVLMVGTTVPADSFAPFFAGFADISASAAVATYTNNVDVGDLHIGDTIERGCTINKGVTYTKFKLSLYEGNVRRVADTFEYWTNETGKDIIVTGIEDAGDSDSCFLGIRLAYSGDESLLSVDDNGAYIINEFDDIKKFVDENRYAGGTLRLNNDITISSNEAYEGYHLDKNCTLDLNGNDLTVYGTFEVNDFILTDSSANHDGALEVHGTTGQSGIRIYSRAAIENGNVGFNLLEGGHAFDGNGSNRELLIKGGVIDASCGQGGNLFNNLNVKVCGGTLNIDPREEYDTSKVVLAPGCTVSESTDAMGKMYIVTPPLHNTYTRELKFFNFLLSYLQPLVRDADGFRIDNFEQGEVIKEGTEIIANYSSSSAYAVTVSITPGTADVVALSSSTGATTWTANRDYQIVSYSSDITYESRTQCIKHNIKLQPYDAEKEVIVTKPTAITTLYNNGEEQELVTAGSVVGIDNPMYYYAAKGTIEYVENGDDYDEVIKYAAPNENTEWSEAVPTAKDTGVYKVWYKIEPDAEKAFAGAGYGYTVGYEPLTVNIISGTAKFTLEDGAVLYSVNDEDETNAETLVSPVALPNDTYYSLRDGSYVIYANKSLTASDPNVIELSGGKLKKPVTKNGVSCTYKYEVTVTNCVNDAKYSITHITDLSLYNKTSSEVYAKNKDNNEEKLLAKLTDSDKYYYGMVPSLDNIEIEGEVKTNEAGDPIDENGVVIEKDEQGNYKKPLIYVGTYGLEVQKGDIYFTASDKTSRALNMGDMVIGNEYWVNADISVYNPFTGKTLNVTLKEKFQYKAKPLYLCDFYLTNGNPPVAVVEDEIAPAGEPLSGAYSAAPEYQLEVKYDEEAQKYYIQVPNKSFVYSGKEQKPAIVVKNTVDGTVTTLVESAEQATDHDYTDALTAQTNVKRDEDGNVSNYTADLTAITTARSDKTSAHYSDEVEVRWAIDPAKLDNAEFDLSPDSFVYDAEAKTLSDFTFGVADEATATDLAKEIVAGYTANPKTTEVAIKRFAKLSPYIKLVPTGKYIHNDLGFDVLSVATATDAENLTPIGLSDLQSKVGSLSDVDFIVMPDGSLGWHDSKGGDVNDGVLVDEPTEPSVWVYTDIPEIMVDDENAFNHTLVRLPLSALFAENSESEEGFAEIVDEAKDAGTYYTEYTVSNGNFESATMYDSFEITKRPVKVLAHSWTKQFLDADPVLTADVEEKNGDRGYIAGDIESEHEYGEGETFDWAQLLMIDDGTAVITDDDEKGYFRPVGKYNIVAGTFKKYVGDVPKTVYVWESSDFRDTLRNYDIEVINGKLTVNRFDLAAEKNADRVIVSLMSKNDVNDRLLVKETVDDKISYFTYDGKQHSVVVKDMDRIVLEGDEPQYANGVTVLYAYNENEKFYTKTYTFADNDFTVGTTTSATSAGDYNVQVRGKGNFTGTYLAPWSIVEANNPEVTVLTNGDSSDASQNDWYVYDGEELNYAVIGSDDYTTDTEIVINTGLIDPDNAKVDVTYYYMDESDADDPQIDGDFNTNKVLDDPDSDVYKKVKGNIDNGRANPLTKKNADNEDEPAVPKNAGYYYAKIEVTDKTGNYKPTVIYCRLRIRPRDLAIMPVLTGTTYGLIPSDGDDPIIGKPTIERLAYLYGTSYVDADKAVFESAVMENYSYRVLYNGDAQYKLDNYLAFTQKCEENNIDPNVLRNNYSIRFLDSSNITRAKIDLSTTTAAAATLVLDRENGTDLASALTGLTVTYPVTTLEDGTPETATYTLVAGTDYEAPTEQFVFEPGTYTLEVYAAKNSEYFKGVKKVSVTVLDVPDFVYVSKVNTAVNPRLPDVHYVQYTFDRNIPEDVNVEEVGYVYIKNTCDDLTVDTVGATVKKVDNPPREGFCRIAVPDEGNGTTAVGFILSNGHYYYTEVASFTYDEMVAKETKEAALKELSVTVSKVNTAVNPNKPDVKYVQYTFDRNVPESLVIEACGYVYIKDKCETLSIDTEGATVKMVVNPPREGFCRIAVPDEGNGTTAVGFVVIDGEYYYSEVVSRTYDEVKAAEQGLA